MKIWLDDLRPPPMEFGWKWAKTVNEAIALLQGDEPLEVVSLDHDLGEFYGDSNVSVELTGLDVLWFLDGNKQWPEKLFIHSANPVGKQSMREFIISRGPYKQMNVTRGGIIFFWDKGDSADVL